ncbi:MAG: type IV pilus modification protein PilV [Magnetococcales bacterium]|nr:type IV pilus modification protein PilV [Magnetococcales bacterium]
MYLISDFHYFTSMRAHSRDGLTLIEVLITMAVTSIALLGIIKMQITDLVHVQNSYLRAVATNLATDMMDRIRANKTGVNNGDYNSITTTPTTITANVTCVTSACSTTTAPTIATYDAYVWRTSVANSFPSKVATATGTVTGCNQNTVPACTEFTTQGTEFTIVISWQLPGITKQSLLPAGNPTSCSAMVAGSSVRDETCYQVSFRPFTN